MGARQAPIEGHRERDGWVNREEPLVAGSLVAEMDCVRMTVMRCARRRRQKAGDLRLGEVAHRVSAPGFRTLQIRLQIAQTGRSDRPDGSAGCWGIGRS